METNSTSSTSQNVQARQYSAGIFFLLCAAAERSIEHQWPMRLLPELGEVVGLIIIYWGHYQFRSVLLFTAGFLLADLLMPGRKLGLLFLVPGLIAFLYCYARRRQAVKRNLGVLEENQ